jgi:Flp pilus assembly pilin Flp
MLETLHALGNVLSAHMRRDDGQTMAEYGMLLGVIAIVVVIAALVLGSSISAFFNQAAGSM